MHYRARANGRSPLWQSSRKATTISNPLLCSDIFDPDSDVKSAISPCGMCRQVIREFCAQDMPILLVPADYQKRLEEGIPDGGVKETSIRELLPDSFGPEDLDRPRDR